MHGLLQSPYYRSFGYGSMGGCYPGSFFSRRYINDRYNYGQLEPGIFIVLHAYLNFSSFKQFERKNV